MLSDDLARWFDEELWRVDEGNAGNRFAHAIAPDDLIADAPSAIWPALMPCDFLPILGNEMGDWLCVRIANDNHASQIVHWYHGGGDWIPWGSSISEAIFFDFVRHRLPGSSRDHAVAAHDYDFENSNTTLAIDHWALRQLQGRLPSSWQNLAGGDLADALLESQLSEPAVRCQCVIDALHNPNLHNPNLDHAVTELWNEADSPRLQQGLFDNQLLHSSWLKSIAGDNQSVDDLLAAQDWDAALRHAQHVTQIAPELAWAWDVVGYVHERSGDSSSAIENYRHGIQCSIFTDQTVRVRTHGFVREGLKFSAARLFELGYTSVDSAEQAYLDCLSISSADERRDRVREHYSLLAEQASGADSHDLWVRAGWDLGAEPMLAFAELLENVAASAALAQRDAASQLAATHRACFRDRYGI